MYKKIKKIRNHLSAMNLSLMWWFLGQQILFFSWFWYNSWESHLILFQTPSLKMRVKLIYLPGLPFWQQTPLNQIGMLSLLYHYVQFRLPIPSSLLLILYFIIRSSRSVVFCRKRCSYKFWNILKQAPMLEDSFFTKVADLHPLALIKK